MGPFFILAIIGAGLFAWHHAHSQPSPPVSRTVPVINDSGQYTGQNALWTSSDAQSKLFGPQFPVAYIKHTGPGGAFMFAKPGAPPWQGLSIADAAKWYMFYPQDNVALLQG